MFTLHHPTIVAPEALRFWTTVPWLFGTVVLNPSTQNEEEGHGIGTRSTPVPGPQ